MNRALRKSLYFVLPLIACLSIAGTGFCLWIFTENHDSDPKELGISIDVKGATTAGTFDSRCFPDPYEPVAPLKYARDGYVFPKTLVFDEGKRGGNPLAQGLSFYKVLQNKKNKGYEYLFEPDYPVFYNESFLSDRVLLTYYRDASIPLEDLASGGLKFNLTMRVILTPELKKYITIFDTLQPVISDAEGQNKVFTIDVTDKFVLDEVNPTGTGEEYTNLIKESLGVSNDPNFNEPIVIPNNFVSTLNYEKRNLHLNFSEFFRWTNPNYKPNDLESYSRIKKLCTLGTEKIIFEFDATYTDIQVK